MSATGYLRLRAFTSQAEIPLQYVTVSVTDTQGNTIAYRTTDRSGLVEQIPIQTPDLSAGTSPNSGVLPFGRVNVYAHLDGYEQIDALDVQIFPGTVTNLNLQMIPLSELPHTWNEEESFQTPAQNL
ncbi:MAG: hypothetical protein IJN53_05340 [Oscillospiraceae bacterium]|nr:hypothetical protein [Oscillospiraceae bacterium]